MKKLMIILVSMLIGFTFITADPGAKESSYAHISYVEASPQIIRADKSRQDAVLNMPLVPGDQIVTGEKDRCEMQFDNGTVLRLDKNSQLKITTVLAQSLISRWKMTTLELLKGQVYALNKSYNLERFQIITPNAAVKLKRSTISTVKLGKKGETYVFSNKGKFQVMFGADMKSLKTGAVKKGQGFTVTADHKFVREDKTDADFVKWNKYVDKNFYALHQGNKLPKEIFRYNKAIVHFAKKWSSQFGEWVYDDILGLVWRPYDEQFAYSKRPFFHARFVTVNNKMLIVPTQPWGWAPAHLGTWVWLKSGWTWVPGNAFRGSALFSSPMFHNHLGYWVNSMYGDWDLYCTYRNFGKQRWSDEYFTKYNKRPAKLQAKVAPKNIRVLLKKLDRAPIEKVKARFAKDTPEMIGSYKVKAPVKRLVSGTYKIGAKGKLAPVSLRAKTALKVVEQSGKKSYVRDWNPDMRWAAKKGVKVNYHSRTNQVVCPKLRVSSNSVTTASMRMLRTGNRRSLRQGYVSSSHGSASRSSSSAPLSAKPSSGSGRLSAKTN
ncbi:MAG: FecR domain-containing protein [bacterium]|nr:FecR domain-containing protein [bacterium]